MYCKIFHLRSFKITTVNWVRYRSVIPVDDNQNFLGMMTNVLKYRVVDKISSKVTGSSPSRLSWRNVSKYANLKSGTSAFALDWNNLLSAQSLISFWQNRLFTDACLSSDKNRLWVFPIGWDENFLRAFNLLSTDLTVLAKAFISFHIKIFDWLSSMLHENVGEYVICSHIGHGWWGLSEVLGLAFYWFFQRIGVFCNSWKENRYLYLFS